ncbi:Protein of uncharacterised function (DUF3795) [uncultured Clostridium sp.]|nr:Protein of uncharacterised function (DUF3795) [uncultured Clostridium sp.]
MKDYRRKDPRFSLCGLNCALCPMHLGGYCPGCGGGEGHQSCAVIRCSREQGEMDYCFECAQFPCPRYDSLTEYDSFIPHRHMVRDLKRVQQIGPAAYGKELEQKSAILQRLLDHYNDGRRKTFYITAVSLLELSDLLAMMDGLERYSISAPNASIKERAAFAVARLTALAGEKHIELKLRKKSKSK